jgi:hypothetical protein
MFKIEGELKEHVESGVACLVATGDADGRPLVRMAWGPRVREDGQTIDVFLDAARAEGTLANLQDNGKVAMTVAHPVNYRSTQFKGTYLERGEPDEAERREVQKRREDFVVSTSLIGDPPEIIANLWLDDLVRVSFKVEAAFDQTPGPEAGRPL